MPLRWTERAALIRLQVCVLGVKSANRDERLSRLTLNGVEKFMVVPNSSYTQDGYHSLSMGTSSFHYSSVDCSRSKNKTQCLGLSKNIHAKYFLAVLIFGVLFVRVLASYLYPWDGSKFCLWRSHQFKNKHSAQTHTRPCSCAWSRPSIHIMFQQYCAAFLCMWFSPLAVGVVWSSAHWSCNPQPCCRPSVQSCSWMCVSWRCLCFSSDSHLDRSHMPSWLSQVGPWTCSSSSFL